MQSSCTSHKLRKIVFSVLVLLAGLVFLEIASRFLLPLRWKTFFTPSGEPAKLAEGPLRLTPNLRLRMASFEYDTTASTTPQGYRQPEVQGLPDAVFVGDSFTFGIGVPDVQTFPALTAGKTGLRCANLGRPDTGTARQLDILEDFLIKEHWRPRKVLLFMTVMTHSLLTGNDLADNLLENEVRAGKANPTTLKLRAFFQLDALLPYSNLSRVVWYYFGPRLRIMLSRETPPQRLTRSLNVTGEQLRRLDQLAGTYGFDYFIFIIHPIQDLTQRTYPETLDAIRRIAPGNRLFDTAPLFADAPRTFYFSRDGHLNAAGHRKIADFLGELALQQMGKQAGSP